MGINDYGQATQPLADPSLSEWAGDVAAALTQVSASVTPAAGWALSASYSTWAQKAGGSVRLNVALQRTSDLAITANVYVTIASLPAGFFPLSGGAPLVNGIYGVGNTCRIEVVSAGSIRARFATAFTFTSGMDLGFTAVYPHA